MRVLLDTNVLLRSADRRSAQHSTTLAAVELLMEHEHDVCVVPQVLYEFWAVATRPPENNGLGMSAADVAQELSDITRFFEFLRDERAVYRFWENLVRALGVTGKQSHDARIAAAMQRHSVGHLLTYNTADFRRYPMVIAFSPLDVVGGRVTLS